jgi:hypothetical protein
VNVDNLDDLKDFGQITLMIDEDGMLNGRISWHIDEGTDPDHGRYLVEALHGMFSALMNDPDHTVELGAAYLLGAVSTELEDDDIEFFMDEGIDNDDTSEQDEPDLTGKIISFTPSNRKH